MKLRSVVAAMGGALLMVLAVGVAPASAATWVGTKITWPAAGACSDVIAQNSHVAVCYDGRYHALYVRDKEADGRSAYGDFTNGVVDSLPLCRNPHGNDTWAVCYYGSNIPSNYTLKYQGYTQDNEGNINWKRNYTDVVSEWQW